MSNSNSTLTQERLKEALHYDQDSGVFTWRVNISSTGREGRRAGAEQGAGYRVIRIDKRLYLEHRLAALYMDGQFPPALIDHKDMDKSNNRWSNLRHATKSENAQNKRVAQANNVKTGLLGVFWSEAQGLWGAKVNAQRKQHHAGFFATPELANAAYVELKRKLHPFGML